MDISLVSACIIFIVHFIADFVLQTHWQAINKSSNNVALTHHVSTYAVCWLLPMSILFYLGPFNLIGSVLLAMAFSIVTFFAHWITDYYTSKLTSKLWMKEAVKEPNDKRLHNFFAAIGFDQTLHLIQLFVTFYILKNI